MRDHCAPVKGHPLQVAMRKHGLEAFEVALLVAAPEGQLNALEIAAIAERGTYGVGGYNASRGGDGVTGLQWTEEMRAAQSARVRGVPLAPETKEKMRLSALANNPFKGRKHSAETKAKIAKATKRLKTGVRLAPEHTAKMSAALRGRRPSVMSPEGRERMIAAHRGKSKPGSSQPREQNAMYGRKAELAPASKPIAVWLPESMVPLIFVSATEAAKHFKVTVSSVADWCRGRYRPKNNCVFAYL